MKWRDWLANWGMSKLTVNVGILEAEFCPNEKDVVASWQLYVELITRVTTQQLPPMYGDERAALTSVHQLFPLTRQILRDHGHGCVEFTRIAIIVLNQVVRPFTAKWHGIALGGALSSDLSRKEFRDELSELQETLKKYTRMLASIAAVEDLTEASSNK